MTLTMLRPERATLRPYLTAQLMIICTRLMEEAKVATIIRLPSARINKESKELFTVCSVWVKPGRSALVESASRASTPSLPSSAKRARSIMPPSAGVMSILKSPVWMMVPAGL